MLTSESDAARGTSLEQTPALQALLLADHVYRDEVTGKYVIAGTFHQVNVEEFPATLGKTVGIFVSLMGAPRIMREVSFELVSFEPSPFELSLFESLFELSCFEPSCLDSEPLFEPFLLSVA